MQLLKYENMVHIEVLIILTCNHKMIKMLGNPGYLLYLIDMTFWIQHLMAMENKHVLLACRRSYFLEEMFICRLNVLPIRTKLFFYDA